jgi:hypothetical protein
VIQERSRSASPRTRVRQETAKLGQAPLPDGKGGAEVVRRARAEAAGPVTNQVTTTPGSARRSTTRSDTDIFLTCGNPTQLDIVRRNRQAWHARGQGFESPKLHIYAGQRPISILKIIFDLLHFAHEGQGPGFLSFTFPQVSSILRTRKDGL